MGVANLGYQDVGQRHPLQTVRGYRTHQSGPRPLAMRNKSPYGIGPLLLVALLHGRAQGTLVDHLVALCGGGRFVFENAAAVVPGRGRQGGP